MTNDTPESARDEDRKNEFRSYAGLALAAVLVILAVWLVNSFREHNRLIECYEAGHHDCAPLDTSARGN
jgi:hypothetical protein